MTNLEETILTMSEFEAIRLVDLNEIPQEQAGTQMQISQSTLSRILRSGRKKIADAIVNGKAIKIEKSFCCIWYALTLRHVKRKCTFI